MGFGLDRLDQLDHDDFELDDVEDQHIASFMFPACKKKQPGWIPEQLIPGKIDIDDWGDE